MGFAAVDQAAGVVAKVVGFAAVTPAAFAAGVANVVGYIIVIAVDPAAFIAGVANVGIVVTQAAFAAGVANVVGFVVVTNVGIVVARAAFAAAVVFPSPQNHSQLLFVTFTLERQK